MAESTVDTSAGDGAGGDAALIGEAEAAGGPRLIVGKVDGGKKVVMVCRGFAS